MKKLLLAWIMLQSSAAATTSCTGSCAWHKSVNMNIIVRCTLYSCKTVHGGGGGGGVPVAELVLVLADPEFSGEQFSPDSL